MKLFDIWNSPGYAGRERLRRTREWGNWKVARALPKRLRYYVTLLEIGRATMDSPNIPATPLDQILAKMDGGPK